MFDRAEKVLPICFPGKKTGKRVRQTAMILMAYRHGLRVSELVDLRWDQIDFDTANLAVRRVKSGSPSTHPIRGDELRHCGGWSASRNPNPPSSSLRSGVRPSPQRALLGLWSALVRLPSWASRLSPSHAAPRLWFRAGKQRA
jgi:integrase